MKVLFDQELFTNTNYAKLTDEKGDLLYWCQNDFSYKNRHHLNNCVDVELCYGQLNFDHNVIEIYSHEDKRIGEILINKDKALYKCYEYDFLNKTFMVNDELVGSIKDYEIDVEDEHLIDCLIMFVLLIDYMKIERNDF